MEKRMNKIINYFILLQILKFNREKTTTIFMKYKDILSMPFRDCLFYFEEKEKDLYFLLNDSFIANSRSVFDSYLNGNIVFIEDENYPRKMLKVKNSPIVFFYKGNLSLIDKNTVSVVGTRNPTDQGRRNTTRLSQYLISSHIVISSGLAKGVDTIAHETAMQYHYGGVIGVIGTPLSKYYPIENRIIQDYVSKEGLLVSEFANFESTLKWNFLRRNFFMSVINDISIVVEAGDTSGTVNQARNTIKNNKPLFVPANVFDNPHNSWPTKFRNEYQHIYKFRDFKELNMLLESHLLKRGAL